MKLFWALPFLLLKPRNKGPIPWIYQSNPALPHSLLTLLTNLPLPYQRLELWTKELA